jgi:peptidyl-prolyl cis-trans isomerase SurA
MGKNATFAQGRLRPAMLLPVVLLLATGCHRSQGPDVMATVNGHPIMKADMEKAYQAQLRQDQQAEPPSQDQADAVRLQVLQGLILQEIVDQRAAKINLTATDAEVEAKLAQLKAPYTEEQFDQKLKANNQTLDDLRRDIRRSITEDKLLNKEVNSKINVSDADVKSYFDSHKAEFNLIEPQYRVAQIQVTDVPSDAAGNLQGSKATNDADARKKIQALKNRLESGEDFGTLAMNFSENPNTAPNGGDMGFFSESEMRGNPAVYNALMKLKPGQTTDILPLLDVQTHRPVGYAIYKLVSREPAGQREINDPRVQQAIRQQLQNGRSQLLKNAYLEMLRNQTKVENFYAEQVFKSDAH